MPIELPLPEPWASAGWKAKIRDKERLEPPHVSVIHRTRTWRWCLRSQAFPDLRPPAGEVPKAVIEHLQSNHGALVKSWNGLYPHNPVSSQERNDE